MTVAMTVLVTGAAGSIGTALLERLPDLGWTVAPVRPRPAAQAASSATSPRLPTSTARWTESTRSCIWPVSPTEAPWPEIREANIEGTFQVFEAARRPACARVVYASSNHAVGFTPVRRRACPARHPAATRHAVRRQQGVRRGARPLLRRPLRHAGRLPADRHVRADRRRTGARCRRGCRRTTAPGWSTRACARPSSPTRSCGASRPTPAAPGRSAEGRALGYDPRDDAEEYRGRARPTTWPTRRTRFVGGGFTSPGFGIDEVAASRSDEHGDRATDRAPTGRGMDRRRGRPGRRGASCSAAARRRRRGTSWPTGSADR